MKLFLLLFFLSTTASAFSQEKINTAAIKYNETVYIFYGTPKITKVNSNLEGSDVHNPPQYATFTIVTKINDTVFQIKFNKWSINANLFKRDSKKLEQQRKALLYNYLQPNKSDHSVTNVDATTNKSSVVISLTTDVKDNSKKISLLEEAYFKISKKDLEEYAYIYNPKHRLEFTIGTISYLTRLRPKIDESIPSRWSTDLSLGLTAGVTRYIGKDAGLSLLLGFAITNTTIDSIASHGFVKSSSQHVALTPSINLLFTYKNFSIGAGIGWDWVNKDSDITKSWAFNNKHFFGIAFGVNIFKSSSDAKTSSSSQ